MEMQELLTDYRGTQSMQIYQDLGQDDVRNFEIGAVIRSVCDYHFLENTGEGTRPPERLGFDPGCSKGISR